MAFCSCSECRFYQYVDTQAREIMRGCMITLEQFREHQKREDMKQAALRRLEPTVPVPVPPPLCPENAIFDGTHQPPSAKGDSTPLPINNAGGSQIPTLKNDSNSTSGTRKGTKHKTSDSSFSIFYSLLCSFRNRLQVRPVATFFQGRSIFFRNPPTKASVKVPGYLELDSGSPQNQAILIHERWLRDGLHRIEFQLRSTRNQTSSHERLLGMMVIRDIKTALDQLEKCKAEEWDRQYTVVRDLTAPVIDTCEKIHCKISRAKLTSRF
jgi:hypothetical protein